MVGDPFGQPLVAAADVEALVGLTEDRQRVLLRLKAEQVNQIEGRLLRRIGAVLDDVRDVEQLSERRAWPPGMRDSIHS